MLKKGGSIKKQLKQTLIVTGVVTALGLSSVASVQALAAQTDSSGSAGLVNAIASKFNLNKDDVKSVFEQYHSEHEQQMEARRNERLQKLVDDGTITESQKSSIEEKLDEMKEEREAHKGGFKNMTPAERKAQMQKHRSDLEAWAKANSLDLSKLRGVLGGPHRGPGGHGMVDSPSSKAN